MKIILDNRGFSGGFYSIETACFIEESLLFLMKKKPDLDCFFLRNSGDIRLNHSNENDRNLTLSKGFWRRKNREVLRQFDPDFWIGDLNLPSIPQIPFGIWLPGPALSREPVKWNRRSSKLLSAATVVFTDTEYHRQALLKRFAFAENKVILLTNAPDPIFQPLSGLEKEQVKSQYAGNKEYFIVTQHLDQQDQLIKLLKSFSLFKRKLQSNMGLVITGADKKTIQRLSDKIKTFKYRDDLYFLSGLSELATAKLVGGAYGFLEPFAGPSGRRVLNAFQCLVPVISISQGVVSEISGQAVLYKDTENPEALGQQLVLLYKNEKLRDEMLERGQAQLQQHNWDKNADQLWLAIHQGSRQK